jgi:hypothetical protein
MFLFLKNIFCVNNEKHEFTVYKLNEKDTPYFFHNIKDFKKFLISNQDTISFVKHIIIEKNGFNSKSYGLFSIDFKEDKIITLLENTLTQNEIDDLLNL